MMFDPLWLILSLPGLALSLICSGYVKMTFSRYQKVRATRGYTGAQAAAQMLARSGVTDVRIQIAHGFLSDNYNPMNKTLNLSEDVYEGRSLAALGVACHEAGHALQHAEKYPWLGLRSALVPITNIGSNLSIYVFMLGLFLQSTSLIYVGIGMFATAVVFALVTLPVEWNASARAKDRLVACGMLSPTEVVGAGRVLNAAFLTYVAAAISSILQLLYFLIRAGLLGGRRDD